MAVQQWLSVDLKEHIKSGKPLQIIDVREPMEFRGGHIPGAKLVPLGHIQVRHKEIDPNVDTVVVCRSGARSFMAAQFLAQIGHGKIKNLMGGMNSWDGEIHV